MTQSPVTVTYSLEEFLTRLEQNLNNRLSAIEGKIDNLQKDVADLKVGQARLEERLTGETKALKTEMEGGFKALRTEMEGGFKALRTEMEGGFKAVNAEIDGLKTRFDSIEKRIEKMESTQKNQVWAMIMLLGGSLVTVAIRFFLFEIPHSI